MPIGVLSSYVLRLVLLIKIKMKAYEESFYLRNDSVPGNDHNG